MDQKTEELGFMEAGVTAHNRGDLENAEALYRKALAINPHNPDALHLLGYLAYQLGFADEGISLIEEAIENSPNNPLFFNNMASICRATRKIDKAIEAYRSSVRLKADDPDVLNDLGNLLREKAISGDDLKGLVEAKKLIRKAIKINPDRAQYHNNLGNILRNSGPDYFDKARKSYEGALKLDPNLVGVLSNLGLLAQAEDNLVLAEEFFKKAVEQAPEDAEAHNNYAQLLRKQNRLEEAITSYEKAEALDPDNYLIGLNKAQSLMQIRRDDDALAALQRLMTLDQSKFEPFWDFAITLRKMGKLREAEKFVNDTLEHFPGNINLRHELGSIYLARMELSKAEELLQGIVDEVGEGRILAGGAGIYATLGVIYLDSGSPEQVIEMFRLAMELEPNNEDARNNYALSLISLGMLEEGWKVFKHRWKSLNFTSPVRPFQKPVWDGQSLAGKTIALWGEQGIGDEIRYASMIPDILDENGAFIIECDKRLVDLFARSFESPQVSVYGREDDFTAPFEESCDYQISTVDLAGFFRNSIESFPPGPYAYLKADPDRIDFWRRRLADIGPGPKVGILWRSILVTNESMPHYAAIEELKPILDVQGVNFINLMYAECSEDRAKALDLFGVDIKTWDDIDLKDDQDDLAALISSVDLVIAPLTATGNLAGALDVPVFTFLTKKRTTELLGHPDAPGWAASMRHFIKGYEEPWDKVMAEMAAEMKRKFGLT